MIIPELVAGCPGAGKTTCLLNYVDDELADGTPPDRIGYVSFTRKATDEARTRACERFNLKKSQLPWFRTLHSLCFAALGLNSADVLHGDALVAFGDWIGVKVSGKVNMEEGASFGFELGDRILFMDNLARVKGISLRQQYDQDPDDLHWSLVEKVSRGLAEYKRQRHVADFTDMVSMFAESEWAARLDVLFVDEAQDLSPLQWKVVARIAKGVRRLVIAGDDDQALFRWAGADVEYFINMQANVRVLGQSWRVPQAVQGIALGAIEQVQARRPKAWRPRPVAGLVTRVQDLDEVDFGTGEDTLVLGRNASFLKEDAEKLLRSEGILYEFRGGQSIKKSLVDAILDWEALRKGERVTVDAAARIYEYMGVGTGITRGYKKLPAFPDREALIGLDDLKTGGGLRTDAIWHDALDRVSAEDRVYMVKALRRGEKLARRPTVRLSTIHGAKGGEADHVVLVRDMAFRTYREMQNNPDDEHRVFYVGATRAKQRLTIVAPQTRRSYDI